MTKAQKKALLLRDAEWWFDSDKGDANYDWAYADVLRNEWLDPYGVQFTYDTYTAQSFYSLLVREAL